MRAVVLDIEGVVNTGIQNSRRRPEAAREALHHQGCRVTAAEYNRVLQQMRDAHSDQPNEAAMWQLFRGFALEAGIDQRRRAREWANLQREFISLAGYVWEERGGVRQLLEELRFNTTDFAGDVPKVIGVTDRGQFVPDALDHAKMSQLFDGIHVTSLGGLRSSDPRLLAAVMNEHQVKPDECIMVGLRLPAFLAPAGVLGCTTIRLITDAEGSMPARNAEEEPTRDVFSVGELGDVIFDWLNAPLNVRQRHGK